MPAQTYEQHEKIRNFADHVREYYPNDIDLFAQIAYMLDHHEGRSLLAGQVVNAARELVNGGTFLVYFDDVDEFGRETKLLDMRFSQQNRWDTYVRRVSFAISAICRTVELTFDDLKNVAKTAIYDRQRFIDDRDRLWLLVTPASNFVINRATEVDIQTCHRDGDDDDSHRLWFVIERSEQHAV